MLLIARNEITNHHFQQSTIFSRKITHNCVVAMNIGYVFVKLEKISRDMDFVILMKSEIDHLIMKMKINFTNNENENKKQNKQKIVTTSKIKKISQLKLMLLRYKLQWACMRSDA